MITRKTRQDTETQAEQANVSSDIGSKEAEFTSLLKKLAYFNRETAKALDSEIGSDKVNRQYTLLKGKLDDAYGLIETIQCLKIDGDESEETIDEWARGNKLKLETYEMAVEKLDERLKYDENIRKEKALDEKLKEESAIREWMRQEEQEAENKKRIREEQFILQLEEKKLQMTEKKRVKPKLPDLKISKFEGTHLDWIRFWSIFSTQIDQTSIPDEAKFSYLKELVTPKVRTTIEKLPADSAGYKKAKEFLEQRYGDPSEVVNSHIQEILSLPVIHGISRPKIHNFYDELLGHVQALETLGKLEEVVGNVRMTLDKLVGVRADLIRTDRDWKKWTFTELVEALRQWVERNPLQPGDKDAGQHPKFKPRDKQFTTKEQSKQRQCVYCEDDHKSGECTKVVDVGERKRILSIKRRCFNCTGERHRAQDCRSKSQCYKCQRRHHTSICDKNEPNPAMCQPSQTNVIYPVVVVELDGVKCRALLDTGSGNSYVSSTLMKLTKKKPVRQEIRTIEMMLHSTSKKIDIYGVKIGSVDKKFSMSSEVSCVDRPVLLTLPNPRYGEVIANNPHLEGVKMDDVDSKPTLPVHMILGASDYSRIKTTTPAKVGDSGKPVGEKTKLGWTIMSPGRETKHSYLMLTRSTQEDYLELCSLDVLGLEDRPEGDQTTVLEEFKEQLIQREDGKYETALPWKAGHSQLPTNLNVARSRFKSLQKRLERQPTLLETYHQIIEDQVEQGIVEIAPTQSEKHHHEHYIPHKPVVREEAKSTKVRIVYDASAKENETSPSLNECLEIGPPLQRKLVDILLRNRVKPVLLAGDIKQAFLQIVIKEEERDALRFLWINNLQSKEEIVYRMTRVMFGLGPSPFILGGTLNVHLEKYSQGYPACVRELKDGTYVDDINLGGDTVEETREMKEDAVKILGEGSFELHKWHSNIAELESDVQDDGETTYAKESLGTTPSETKLLGLGWNKAEDTLIVTFPQHENEVTKRVVLRTTARIYDPLGLASPILLTAKVIFREICDAKLGWDVELSEYLKRRWENWLKKLPIRLTMPRAIPREIGLIVELILHGFADASLLGCCAVIYAVIKQTGKVSQGFLISKARLAKRDLTIPRLELVSCHMLSNLLHNVVNVLSHLHIGGVFAWTDSTVCLQWIQGQGKYKQFVANRVQKINEKEGVVWNHVPSQENPADIGSRGASELQTNETWMNGPAWLNIPDEWPEKIVTKPTDVSESESRSVKTVMKTTFQRKSDPVDDLLAKTSLWKAVRILAWMKRFAANCRRKEKIRTPLRTEETEEVMKFLIRRAQQDGEKFDHFKEHCERLNLQKNEDGIYVCKGRIQGVYPVYLPSKHLLSQKIVERAHLFTLHGGVGLTMSKVRDDYWIPTLRSLVKKVIGKCYGCKRYHVTPIPAPSPGNLPKERTEGEIPFEVTGVDYAGPIYYKRDGGADRKAYMIIYTCSLTRGLHLEILPDMSCEEFLMSLKRFIAARGRPKKIISDNGKTFVAASRWIKKIERNEKLHGYLNEHGVKWQFNLSKASWWGGMFERMVALVKQAFYKVVGSAKLTFKELQDVMLDIQIILNNRPLTYCEDDIQLPVLTPNMMIFGKANYLMELSPEHIEERDLRKRAKYLQKCKDALWQRWRAEYMRALRERHNLTHNVKERELKRGDVVLIKGEEKNRGLWKIGIVEKLISGRDSVVRGVRLRAGKSFLERPIQFLYPMELHCEREEKEKIPLNPTAREFRPKRKAAVDARRNIELICGHEDENT
ncbi:uncharacterized protein LOC114519022 [Dendronephthya gigantea]|uniref:uncharacterized protein LOC114519022 n=1 Tax=Dendronephthya gigantea TaxID=151771 RepID=UPI00106AFC30|nr:uncharacterized protein LOC114519022 [Dendronephthya gigantea]